MFSVRGVIGFRNPKRDGSLIMSLVTWQGKLLLTNGKLTLGPAAAACCCVESACDSCCGDAYDGPGEFGFDFDDGAFSGGQAIPSGSCDCCECIASSLETPGILTGVAERDCQWSAVADICTEGIDGWVVTAGQIVLTLTCEIIGGVAVVTASLQWEIHPGQIAEWKLVGFDCTKTEEDPNVLLAVSNGGCDTVPNEAWIWGI